MPAPAPAQALTPAQAQQAQQALTLLQGGQAARALELARTLAAAAPAAPDALQLHAMCLADAGAGAEAERVFRQAIALAPAHPLLLVNFAMWLRKVGRGEEALAFFSRVTQVAPTFAKGWIERGRTAAGLGLHEQARDALAQGVRLKPDDAIAWHALGSVHRALGDLEAAESALVRAVALAPQAGAAITNLGVVQRLSGRPDEALATLQRIPAGQATPEHADALAGVLLDTGRVAEALALARATVRAHPDFVAGHATLAHLRWEYADAAPGEDAIEGLRDACRARPHDVPLRLALVDFLATAKHHEEALAHVRDLRRGDDAPMLVFMEADLLDRLGDTASAKSLYARAASALGEGHLAFLNAHARFFLKTGDPAAAATRAEAALRLDPANQEAWAYLGTAWRLLGDAREHWLCDAERLVGLVEVEPPPGYADTGAFLAHLRATLEPLHQAAREPLQQSLRGGSQTAGRLFGRPEPAIAAAQAALRQAVERWIATLPADPKHPFLQRRQASVRFVGSWSVRLWSAGRHVNHIHPEGWMSSAFYVALPPSLGTESTHGQAGCLQLGQPPDELGLDLPPRRVLRPEPGKLALFPSYFWHGTVPFDDAHPRLTIAFDMQPRARSR
jgi:tetratricopeptide (TPR) repeat protein